MRPTTTMATLCVAAIVCQVAVGRADPARSLSIQVRAQAKTGSVVRSLSPGGRTFDNDRLELFVRSDASAYLYLVQFLANGTSQIVYPPRQGVFRVDKNVESRVPPPGKWLRLDDSAGQETLYLIISEQMIEQADVAVARAIGRLEVARGIAAQSRRKPKADDANRAAQVPVVAAGDANTEAMPDRTWQKRAVILEDEDPEHIVRAESRGAHAAIFAFSYDHQHAPRGGM